MQIGDGKATHSPYPPPPPPLFSHGDGESCTMQRWLMQQTTWEKGGVVILLMFLVYGWLLESIYPVKKCLRYCQREGGGGGDACNYYIDRSAAKQDPFLHVSPVVGSQP